MKINYYATLAAAAFLVSCQGQVSKAEKKQIVQKGGVTVQTAIGPLELPAPFAGDSKTKRNSIVKWEGKMPVAPDGFEVHKFAEDFDGCRWLYQAANGDVFVSESYGDRIAILRDEDQDGSYETRKTYASGLNKPFGMLVLGNSFYIANTDGLYQYPYNSKSLSVTGKGKKILSLPAGGYNNHWTRNLLASQDGKKIYVTVGSGSNVGENGMEHEVRRACILEINPDGSGEKIFASGLRNPVGMDWNPENGKLWTAVNERDGLGNDLVPDYITSVERDGFYGWPYAYFGSNLDPRMKGQGKDLAAKAIVPDVPVGSHTASLSVTFYDKDAFPAQYKNGAFVGQHGSWNRDPISGYKVLFVPFKNGKPTGKPQDFLTGFIANNDKADVYGRPVCVSILDNGDMLVSDDGSNTIWKITAKK